MRRWQNLSDGYISECQTRGLATSTVEGRRRELERWGSWMRCRRPRPKLEEVDADLLIRYVRSRSAFHGRYTVAGIMSTMRCMGEYLVRESIWESNPLRWIKGPRVSSRSRLPRRVSKEALEKLWAAAAGIRGRYRRYQWVTVLAVLYGTGLRIGELERLNIDDWNAAEGTLRVFGAKTGRERILPVSDGVRQCIEAYLPYRQNCLEKAGRLDERALFVGPSSSRMRRGQTRLGISRLAAKAGIPRVTPHQFRHTCASDLLESGVSLPEVKGMLGHVVITSTMRYVHVADPERRRAIDRHPINDMLADAAG